MRHCQLILLLCFLVLGHTGKSQLGENIPVVYDQFFKNYYLLNPASVDTTDKISIGLGNRTLTGLFEGVNRLYADINIRAKHGRSGPLSHFGINVQNNRDGDFINRSRVYGRYAFSARISARSSLSLGTSFGFVNYSFQASQAGGGGSSTAFDANAGLWYLRKKLSLGVSYQQMVKPNLRPAQQPFLLPSYINANLIFRNDISAFTQLATHVYIRYQQSVRLHFEVAPILTFHERLETGINYRYQRGIAIIGGIKKIYLGNGSIRVMASYLFSTQKFSSLSDNVLEFSVGYQL